MPGDAMLAILIEASPRISVCGFRLQLKQMDWEVCWYSSLTHACTLRITHPAIGQRFSRFRAHWPELTHVSSYKAVVYAGMYGGVRA